MRIIMMSPNRLLHNQWNKALSRDIEIKNLYFEEEITSFDYKEKDIVLFDYDNLSNFLIRILQAKVMCLSSKLDNIKGFRLLKEGVKGYGNTYMTPLNLKEAIKVIGSDKVWIYPELMSFIIEHSTLSTASKQDTKINELSTREFDVSKLVSRGLTNKQIAGELNITERTVKAHISAVFAKFDIKDRVTLGIRMKDHVV